MSPLEKDENTGRRTDPSFPQTLYDENKDKIQIIWS